MGDARTSWTKCHTPFYNLVDSLLLYRQGFCTVYALLLLQVQRWNDCEPPSCPPSLSAEWWGTLWPVLLWFWSFGFVFRVFLVSCRPLKSAEEAWWSCRIERVKISCCPWCLVHREVWHCAESPPPPPTVCSSTMAAMGPKDGAGAGTGGMAVCPLGPEACASATTHNSNGPNGEQTQVSRQRVTKPDDEFVLVYFSHCFAPSDVRPSPYAMTLLKQITIFVCVSDSSTQPGYKRV